MRQLINAGVPHELMEDTMALYKEFFQLPNEEISKYAIHGTKNNQIRYWKDCSITHDLRLPEEQVKNQLDISEISELNSLVICLGHNYGRSEKCTNHFVHV